jgi:hypothetical protein
VHGFGHLSRSARPRVPVRELRADEERRGVVAELVSNVADDLSAEPIQCGIKIPAGEQGSAAVKLVERSGPVPRLADAVGIEEQPLAWAEFDDGSLARADRKLGQAEWQASLTRFDEACCIACEQQGGRVAAVEDLDRWPATRDLS